MIVAVARLSTVCISYCVEPPARILLCCTCRQSDDDVADRRPDNRQFFCLRTQCMSRTACHVCCSLSAQQHWCFPTSQSHTTLLIENYLHDVEQLRNIQLMLCCRPAMRVVIPSPLVDVLELYHWWTRGSSIAEIVVLLRRFSSPLQSCNRKITVDI